MYTILNMSSGSYDITFSSISTTITQLTQYERVTVNTRTITFMNEYIVGSTSAIINYYATSGAFANGQTYTRINGSGPTTITISSNNARSPPLWALTAITGVISGTFDIQAKAYISPSLFPIFAEVDFNPQVISETLSIVTIPSGRTDPGSFSFEWFGVMMISAIITVAVAELAPPVLTIVCKWLWVEDVEQIANNVCTFVDQFGNVRKSLGVVVDLVRANEIADTALRYWSNPAFNFTGTGKCLFCGSTGTGLRIK